jgi:probable HAF family extracellular repeat protein
MKNVRLTFSLAALVVIFAILNSSSTCYSTQPSFKGIGFLPGSFTESEATGVSGNGKVVVGHCNSGGFWWSEETGMLPTASSWGGKVSFDGSVVASTTRGWRAFKWTANEGVYSVVADGENFYSISSDISDDGSVIVGQTLDSGFIWKPGVSFTSISGKANGISSDSITVVGESGGQACKWTQSGQMIGLGLLSGSTNSKAHAISDDGKIVGQSYWGSRNEAFLWTEQSGMIGLGYLSGGNSSWAKDISADGKTVIGLSYTNLGTEAFVWDSQNGMRNLRLVLQQDYNLNLTGWILDWAQSISADGTVIVGRGTNPLGQREAWVATIPEPATLLLIGLGGMVLRRGKHN